MIDGKRASERVLARVTEKTRALAAQGLKPGLAVVLVGDDPASQVYVKSKSKAAQACGFHSVQHDLAATTSEAELLALVEQLNADPAARPRQPRIPRHQAAQDPHHTSPSSSAIGHLHTPYTG